MTTSAPIVALEILSASVWTGSLVCLAVVSRAARTVLEGPAQVVFFRAVGRLYAIVGTGSLLVAIGTGLAIAGPPPTWSATIDTAVALAGLLVLANRGVHRPLRRVGGTPRWVDGRGRGLVPRPCCPPRGRHRRCGVRGADGRRAGGPAPVGGTRGGRRRRGRLLGSGGGRHAGGRTSGSRPRPPGAVVDRGRLRRPSGVRSPPAERFPFGRRWRRLAARGPSRSGGCAPATARLRPRSAPRGRRRPIRWRPR